MVADSDSYGNFTYACIRCGLICWDNEIMIIMITGDYLIHVHVHVHVNTFTIIT